MPAGQRVHGTRLKSESVNCGNPCAVAASLTERNPFSAQFDPEEIGFIVRASSIPRTTSNCLTDEERMERRRLISQCKLCAVLQSGGNKFSRCRLVLALRKNGVDTCGTTFDMRQSSLRHYWRPLSRRRPKARRTRAARPWALKRSETDRPPQRRPARPRARTWVQTEQTILRRVPLRVMWVPAATITAPALRRASKSSYLRSQF